MERSATFTMRLKDVMKVLHADADTGVGIGLDDYPVFDPAHRTVINNKIINHYWNREIGRETLEDFRFALRRTMHEIMPYYNQLYLTEQIKFDPLSTIDIDSTNVANSDTESKGDSESDSKATSKADALNVSNTFPQTALDDNNQGNYADSGNESNSTSETDSNVSENRNETSTVKQDSTGNTKGYTGAAADLLMRFRATLLNIDMMIIADVNPLFMNIWDNGDTYSENGFVA